MPNTPFRGDPRTKEQFLDRLLSFDFGGDIRELGAEPAQIKRIARNRIEVFFPASDRRYEMSVRLPRRATEGRSFKPAKPEEPATAKLPKRGRPRKQ